MLPSKRLFRIASEVRETDMAFLIPILARMIPVLPAQSAAAPARRRGSDFFAASDPGFFVSPAASATFSLVDARDVAEAIWLAAQKGQRGERYLPGGRHMPMGIQFRPVGDSQQYDPLVPTERLAENPGAEQGPAACGGTAHRTCRKPEVRSVS
jgi:hypothetical protein